MQTSIFKVGPTILILASAFGCAQESATQAPESTTLAGRPRNGIVAFEPRPAANAIPLERKLVAQVLGNEIYEEDLDDSPDAEFDETMKPSGSIRDRRNHLEAMILGPLVQKYCTEHNLDASDDDEELKVAREIFGVDATFWSEFLEDQRSAIASGELTDSGARTAKELIALLENEPPERYQDLYATFLRSKLDSPEVTDSERQEFAEVLAMIEGEKQVPEAMVKSWKFDRQVFEQYGGVVIFQQMNPFEPVGAYKLWLEQCEKDGDFSILDPQLRSAFWEYYNTDWATTPWIVRDPHPFDQPWWMKEPETSSIESDTLRGDKAQIDREP